jgi:hypothetical protein
MDLAGGQHLVSGCRRRGDRGCGPAHGRFGRGVPSVRDAPGTTAGTAPDPARPRCSAPPDDATAAEVDSVPGDPRAYSHLSDHGLRRPLRQQLRGRAQGLAQVSRARAERAREWLDQRRQRITSQGQHDDQARRPIRPGQPSGLQRRGQPRSKQRGLPGARPADRERPARETLQRALGAQPLIDVHPRGLRIAAARCGAAAGDARRGGRSRRANRDPLSKGEVAESIHPGGAPRRRRGASPV